MSEQLSIEQVRAMVEMEGKARDHSPAPMACTHNPRTEESRVYCGVHQRAVFDGRLITGEREAAEFYVALRNAAPQLLADWLRMREAIEKIVNMDKGNFLNTSYGLRDIARAALPAAQTRRTT